MSTTPERPDDGEMTVAGSPSAIDRILADPSLRSRDDDGVVAIAVGTVLWLTALVALLTLGDQLTGSIDVDRWILVCAIGAVLGIPGLGIVLARRARLRRAASPR